MFRVKGPSVTKILTPLAQCFKHPAAQKRQNRQRMERKRGLAYGRLVYRFRWPVLFFWLAMVLVSVPCAFSLSHVLQNSGYSIQRSESTKVTTIMVTTLHQPSSEVLVVFQSVSLPVSDPRYQAELQVFRARARTFWHVMAVSSGSVGQDGRTTTLSLGFDQDADVVATHLADVRALIPAGPARAYLTGEAAVSHEVQIDTQKDLESAEMIALPLTLLVLLLVFGSLVAALVPVILAGVVVSASLAGLYLVAVHGETNIFAQSLITVLGLGLAIDYSLILIRRFREELAHKTVCEAVACTVATAGEAILWSGILVIVSFAGLLIIGIGIMTSFAIAGMAVASIAVLAALTLLPALLSILGPRVNALRLVSLITGRRSLRVREEIPRTLWRQWALLVMRHPWLSVGISSVLLLLLAAPTLTLNPGLPGADALPMGSEARYGLTLLQEQFPTFNDDPIFLIAHTPDGSSMLSSHNLTLLASLTQHIEEQNHVRAVVSLTSLPAGSIQDGWSFSQNQLLQWYRSGAYHHIPALRHLVAATTVGDTTLLSLRVDTIAGSSADQALIDHLRTLGLHTAGLTVLVGGSRVVSLDFDRVLYHNFGRTLLCILLVTYGLLLCMFRSLVLPLKAILMNVLSIGAAYGVLILVFQQGYFAQALHFTSDGFIDRFIPLLLFCVLMGLSMDYEVFLLSRVREEWVRTRDNTQAVALGLEKTGSVITNAALLFMIVSGAFVLTSLIVTRELGLGISVAVLVDATLVRCVLVPATMRLLGTWNWWLPRLSRGV